MSENEKEKKAYEAETEVAETEKPVKEKKIKETKVIHSLVTFAVLVGVMSVAIIHYEVDPHVPMFIGVERNAVVSRSNEAGGYRLTVTETRIDLATPGNIACTAGTPVPNGDVRVSWETRTSA